MAQMPALFRSTLGPQRLMISHSDALAEGERWVDAGGPGEEFRLSSRLSIMIVVAASFSLWAVLIVSLEKLF